MFIRAYVVACVLLVACPVYAQNSYQDPQDVCGSVGDVGNSNQLSRYENCLYDNVGTLVYGGVCGEVNTSREASFAASDVCEWFVVNQIPSSQVNGGNGVNGGAISVLVNVFGLMAILAMSRIGGI